MNTTLTRAQREALFDLYRRSGVSLESKKKTYLQFRRTARMDCMLGCLMIPFCGMLVGIEWDGYTHS